MDGGTQRQHYEERSGATAQQRYNDQGNYDHELWIH